VDDLADAALGHAGDGGERPGDPAAPVTQVVYENGWRVKVGEYDYLCDEHGQVCTLGSFTDADRARDPHTA
jgi:hypothetical protein